MNELTSVKQITNIISETIYVELDDRVVELEPGKSLHNVKIQNLKFIRPYLKVMENLTEVSY